MTAAASIRNARRLVIKIGSALLCNGDGALRESWLNTVAEDIGRLRKAGTEVIVVTSGAVALGRHRLDLDGDLRLEEKQAASAVGQIALASAWQTALGRAGLEVAQILLTLDDTENRRRYLNARATFRTLLDLGVVPVVNENDTITTAEIRYGDNDRLAAHAAQISGSDLLLILSDVDGLYDADPNKNAEATHIAEVTEITPEIEALAGGANILAGVGSGGMASKLAAAKIAARNGCATIIGRGGSDHPVSTILDGARATLFQATGNRESARRQWISGRLKPAGNVTIDAGAARAIFAGASLLPAGIIQIEGDFARGDAVLLLDEKKMPLAQGLAMYHANEAILIAGKSSDEIERILGYQRRPAFVEKDDLVLLTGAKNE